MKETMKSFGVGFAILFPTLVIIIMLIAYGLLPHVLALAIFVLFCWLIGNAIRKPVTHDQQGQN